MTIIPFKTPEQIAREDRQRKLIERLDQLREDAAAGRITALAYTTLSSDNRACTAWIGGCRSLREQVSVLYRRLKDACERNGL